MWQRGLILLGSALPALYWCRAASVWPVMIAGGAGGPVCLILLPDLVNLGVVEVDMLRVDLVDLLVYGVRNDEGRSLPSPSTG